MKIYLNPEVYRCLDDMTMDLRTVIQSRAVPDSMIPTLRTALSALHISLAGCVPDPVVPTWEDPSGGDAA